MVRAETLEKAILDVINWAAKYPNRSELGRETGVSRQALTEAAKPNWDPHISTIVALAKARETLYPNSM